MPRAMCHVRPDADADAQHRRNQIEEEEEEEEEVEVELGQQGCSFLHEYELSRAKFQSLK